MNYEGLNLLDNLGIDEDDEYYEEFTDEKELQKALKKANSVKRNKEQKRKHANKDTSITLPKWRYNLIEREEIYIVSMEHSIHYKEQDWLMPSRNIQYFIELVKLTGEARKIAELVTENTRLGQLASDGVDRWYKVVTYENVPQQYSRIGYVRLTVRENRVGFTCYFDDSALKAGNFDVYETKLRIKKKVRKMLGGDKRKHK